MRLGNRIKRKIGFILVIAMLIVMIYPEQPTFASDGFVINDAGVLEQYNGAENAVVIPDGVTAIGDSAFQGKDTITSVMIPAGVTSIGSAAFLNCTSLTGVTIPASVTSVGSSAFHGCTSLTSLSWESSAGIPDNAFSDCKSLSSVSFSTSVPSIGSEAFSGCESLGRIAIPASTGNVASNAFDGCINMTEISVDPGNAFYKTYDGCLYSDTGLALYRCPQGKHSVQIMDGTQVIASNAFYGCNIATVNLPASVTTVSQDAFAVSEVQTLRLTQSVSSFGAQNTFRISCIEVPGASPVAGELLNFYGEIVVTDFVPTPPDTEEPTPPDTEEPTPPDTEEPTPPDTEEPDNPNPPSTEEPGDPNPPSTEDSGNPNPPGPDNPGDGNSGDNGGNSGNNSGNNNGGNSGNNSGNNNGGNSGSNNSGNSGGSNSGGTGNKGSGVSAGIPYITGNKGLQGWDAIMDQIESAPAGMAVEVAMNGATIVPAKVLEALKAEKRILVLDMSNGIKWRIDGAKITADAVKDIDFGVMLGTGNVPESLIRDVAGEDYAVQMRLAYEGILGLDAYLTVNIGNVAAGKYATLYYYNEQGKKLEYIAKEMVQSGGDVTFSFNHASDYVIVVEGLSAGEVAMANTSDGAHVKDNTPKTGPGLNAKYILCLGVMLLGVYMILTSKKTVAVRSA